MPDPRCPMRLGQGNTNPQDAQKGQTFHPPSPGGYFTHPPCVCQDRLFTLGRALSHARPQRVNKYDTSKLAVFVVPGMTRMSPPLRATFSPSHPLADIFHPPYPPIA